MIRIGIFFGGPSREREISFAGGKTAFEHLDKTLFQPVPIFIDGFGRFVLIEHKHMYAPDIRSFYTHPDRPNEHLYIESYPELKFQEIPTSVGRLIDPSTLPHFIDFALLAMHGPDCEDGGIQGLLEWYRIPYSGPGLLGSSIGIDKILQNKLLKTVTGQQKASVEIRYEDWKNNPERVFSTVKQQIGLPIVLKAPHQGSSIGVAIVKQDDFEAFSKGINQCFFTFSLSRETWDKLDATEKKQWANAQTELESGIGYPLYVDDIAVYRPNELLRVIERLFEIGNDSIELKSSDFEPIVLCESFVEGQEFSCGCLQLENGTHVALPPTEVIKVDEVFDFNSKYRSGGTRKRIPVATTLDNNRKIQETIVHVAERLGMSVCVRIDGFLTPAGKVVLHDPNTVPGMSPTSLIFKQMAEIGLNITQSLTYLIRQSLNARIRSAKNTVQLIELLQQLDQLKGEVDQKQKPVQSVVIEPNDEVFAHTRKWYSRLCAEGVVKPEVWLRKDAKTTVKLPVQWLFKDTINEVFNALETETDPLIIETRHQCSEITRRYAGDATFEPEFRTV